MPVGTGVGATVVVVDAGVEVDVGSTEVLVLVVEVLVVVVLGGEDTPTVPDRTTGGGPHELSATAPNTRQPTRPAPPISFRTVALPIESASYRS
jgi:hypothetical protein